MKRRIALNQWLIVGVSLEILIFLYSYLSTSEINEAVKLSARYSGRLSFLVYLVCLYFFAADYSYFINESKHEIKKLITVFCVLHFIHFGFLASNIYLNHIELIPYKLAGGFLAYSMILIYPFVINHSKLPKAVHIIYFYYVGLVMFLTFLGRIKDGFQGSSPSIFHYFGLISIGIAFLISAFLIFKKNK